MNKITNTNKLNLIINKLKSSILIKNTFILLLASIIIKILSLLNRIIMTRMISSSGISLYIISLPTIMLFTSIGGFSLNIGIAREISLNKDNHSYIIKKGLKIAFIMSLLSSVILFLIAPILSKYALKQQSVTYILILSIPFIIITSINNVFKGYLQGLNNMNSIAVTSLLEQISRFILTIILLYIFRNSSSLMLVLLLILTMTIGELFSLLYNIYKTYKNKPVKNRQTPNNKDKIFSLSLNTTLSHLSYNVTSFLEPIIYTFCLNKLFISSETILFKYSEINAYTLPTLSLVTFVSFQISQTLLPLFTNSYQNNNKEYIEKTLSNIIYYLLIFGIFTSNVFYYFGKDILNLLYGKEIGLSSLKIMAYFFIFSYINPIIIVFLQASGNDKFILKTNIILSILKLIVLFILSINPITSNYSLIITIIFYLIISEAILFIKASKLIKIKIPVLKIVFLFLFIFILFYLITSLNIYFLYKLIILFVFIMITLFCLQDK